MQVVELTLALLLLTAVGGVLVCWTKIGLPIFLVLVGVVASLLPGLRGVSIDPDVFLLLFIPPLLFADARVLPRRDLMHVLRPVLLMALGLVVLTVLVVGWFIHWLVPAMPLAVAFKLAVAAAAAAASSVTPVDLASNFVLLSGGGACVGWVVEKAGRKAREALIGAGANDPVLQTLLAVLLPYAAYLAAEALHVSGVQAVVVAALWAGGREVNGLLPALHDPGQRSFVQQLIHRYQCKVNLRESPPEQAAAQAGRIATARRLRRVGIDAERDCLHRLHALNTINDETVRVIEQELDEREIVSSAAAQRGQFGAARGAVAEAAGDAAVDAGKAMTAVMLPTQPSVCPGLQAATSAGCNTALRTTPDLRVIE